MKRLERAELEGLLTNSDAPCVSAFMPTERAGLAFQQEPVRLKNLLRQAEERLIAKGHRSADVKRLLAPTQKAISDDELWRHPLDGLALFCSPSFFAYYALPLRLDELVVVGDRFYVKPVLRLFTGDGRFFVLALSQNQVRLLQATRDSVEQVPLHGVPMSVDEALRHDEFEKQRRFQGTQRGRTGGRTTIFQGHGDDSSSNKEDLLQFFRQVDKGLQQVLRDERAPLVLAGVDYLLPLYKEVNSYPHVLAGGVEGNPEVVKPEDLRRQAWEVVGPHFESRQTEAAAKFKELTGTGRTSRKIREALPAAHAGRVEALFVAAGAQYWGSFDPATSSVRLHDAPETGDEELLDLAATQTILQRGTVYVVERDQVPGGGPIAAVFRY